MIGPGDKLRDSDLWHRNCAEIINQLAGGWSPEPGTVTYVSASTLTVPLDQIDKYQVGGKVKLTQTTVKYFYVTGISSNILTLNGGTDYTLLDRPDEVQSSIAADFPVNKYLQYIFELRGERIGDQADAARRAEHLGLQAALPSGQVHQGRQRLDVRGGNPRGVEYHRQRGRAAEEIVLQVERDPGQFAARRQAHRWVRAQRKQPSRSHRTPVRRSLSGRDRRQRPAARRGDRVRAQQPRARGARDQLRSLAVE